MIAGIILSDSRGKDSKIAMLEDETVSCRTVDDEELSKILQENSFELIAVDAGSEMNKDELTSEEEDLKDEGFNFTPTFMQKSKTNRLGNLKSFIVAQLGEEEEPPEWIRFSPHITAEELAVSSDKDITSYGLTLEDVGSAEEFDAVLGVLTAVFYKKNSYSDKGMIVPENV